MKLLLSLALCLLCLPIFGQRFVDEVPNFAALKSRLVGNLDKSVFVRGGIVQNDGLGGIYTLTNSNTGVDGFLRIQSTQNPAFSYDRWMIPAIGIFNFGDQFTIIDNSNVVLNSTSLSLSNVTFNGATTVKTIELGQVCGPLDVDAGSGDEFNLLLTCDSTLNMLTWPDAHNVNLTVTNTGNFSLIINSPYARYRYATATLSR
jgi:hypothetical protein